MCIRDSHSTTRHPYKKHIGTKICQHPRTLKIKTASTSLIKNYHPQRMAVIFRHKIARIDLEYRRLRPHCKYFEGIWWIVRWKTRWMQLVVTIIPDHASLQDGHKEKERFRECYFEVERPARAVDYQCIAKYIKKKWSLYQRSHEISPAFSTQRHQQNNVSHQSVEIFKFEYLEKRCDLRSG